MGDPQDPVPKILLLVFHGKNNHAPTKFSGHQTTAIPQHHIVRRPLCLTLFQGKLRHTAKNHKRAVELEKKSLGFQGADTAGGRP